MLDLFVAILPVFIVVGFGYLAVRNHLFPDSAVEGLMLFAQSFALPALLFRAMSTLDLSTLSVNLFLSYYGGATASFLWAMIGARLIFRRPWEDSIAIGFGGLFANGLLLGVPVTQQAFGPDSTVANFAIISINSIYCYGIGITLMEIARARKIGASLAELPSKVMHGMFRNNLILGIMAGLVVNLSGVALPGFFTDALDLMSRAALPAALFGLGGVLCHYRPEGDLRTIAWLVSASLIIHPAMTWLIGTSVHLEEAAFRSSMVMAAMAPGVNAYIFATIYGVAKRVVASSVLIGTVLSRVTSGAWLTLWHSRCRAPAGCWYGPLCGNGQEHPADNANQPGEIPRSLSERRRSSSTVVNKAMETITRIVATDRMAGEICSRMPFHIWRGMVCWS